MHNCSSHLVVVFQRIAPTLHASAGSQTELYNVSNARIERITRRLLVSLQQRSGSTVATASLGLKLGTMSKQNMFGMCSQIPSWVRMTCFSISVFQCLYCVGWRIITKQCVQVHHDLTQCVGTQLRQRSSLLDEQTSHGLVPDLNPKPTQHARDGINRHCMPPPTRPRSLST